jgi:hypothetical protein
MKHLVVLWLAWLAVAPVAAAQSSRSQTRDIAPPPPLKIPVSAPSSYTKAGSILPPVQTQFPRLSPTLMNTGTLPPPLQTRISPLAPTLVNYPTATFTAFPAASLTGVTASMRQWELSTSAGMGAKLMGTLPSESQTMGDAWRGFGNNIGDKLLNKGLEHSYMAMGGTFNSMANTFRAGRAMTYNSIAEAYQRMGLTSAASLYRGRMAAAMMPTEAGINAAAMGWRIYSGASMVAGAVISGADTFYQTVDRVAKSAQMINPPIFLDTRTSRGWTGAGAYDIPGGHVAYTEELVSGGRGPITRIHEDRVITANGVLTRRVESSIPASSSFERWLNYHYPTGMQWDPSATITTTQTFTSRTMASPSWNSSLYGASFSSVYGIKTLPSMPMWNSSVALPSTWNQFQIRAATAQSYMNGLLNPPSLRMTQSPFTSTYKLPGLTSYRSIPSYSTYTPPSTFGHH